MCTIREGDSQSARVGPQDTRALREACTGFFVLRRASAKIHPRRIRANALAGQKLEEMLERRAKEESVLHKPEKMTLSNVYSSRNKGLHSQTSYNFISARSIRFQSERTQLYVLVQELLAISLNFSHLCTVHKAYSYSTWLAAKNILETRQRENSGLDIFVSKKMG